jgi:RHH-type proline utilization regulon transcriptional repressor/proline dehydrogenase/delta 1-pyrroline-5-carboxylate dehydrogenase
MPGPTGETNQLSAHPRGLVLCLGPTRADALLQAISALAQQNSVVIVAEQAAQLGELLHQAGMSAAGIDGSVEPESLRIITGVDAIMSQADVEPLRAYRIALAERDGKLIPLISGLDELDRLIVERHLCIDTTAAGGNASLIAADS